MIRDNLMVSIVRLDASGVATITDVRTIVSSRWQVVGAGDFDHDHKSDLLLRNMPSRQLSIWFMDGTTLRDAPALSTLLETTAWQIAGIADFDNDQKSDILLRNGVDGGLKIWRMDGATILSITSVTSPLELPWRVVDAADFDGNGKADILYRNPQSGELRVWYMDGANVLDKVTIATSPKRVVGVSDVSGDGKADILLQDMTSGTIDIWSKPGSQATTTQFASNVDRRWHLSSAIRYRQFDAQPDFNGDGCADILLRNSDSREAATWELNGRVVLLSDVFATTAPYWNFEQIGMIGADAMSDIQLQNTTPTGTNRLAVWELAGQAVLNSDEISQPLSPDWRPVAMGDLDGDGNSDIVFRTTTTPQHVWVRFMAGHTTRSNEDVGTIATDLTIAGTGDFNGDGMDDIVLRSTIDDEVYVWEMNGKNIVQRHSLDEVDPPAMKISGIADFNGDGLAEIFFRDTVTNDVALWNIQNWLIVDSSVFGRVISSDWKHQSVADYDGDGHADIVLRNVNSVAMWEMNGDTVINTAPFASVASTAWEFYPPTGVPSGAASFEPLIQAMSAIRTAFEPQPSPFGTPTHGPANPGPPTARPNNDRNPTWVPARRVPTHKRGYAHFTFVSSSTEPAQEESRPEEVQSENIEAVGTSINARLYFYSPAMNLMATTEAKATGTRAIEYEYVWFGGQPVAQIESLTNTFHWYFNDHLGTPILTTTSTATIDWRVEREPYGKVYTTRVGASRYQPLGFPGQENDGTSELSYNIFRWYRVGWGRYTQSDPLETQVEGVINGYRYALSNPLRWIDPTGLEATHSSDIINCVANPWDCIKGNKCKKEATEKSEKKYGYAKDGTPQNAYKHCYWNCCMTKAIDAMEAKKFGDAHENYPENNSCDKEMDLWNNEQGRKVTGETTCDQHCSEAPLQLWKKCKQCGGLDPWPIKKWWQ